VPRCSVNRCELPAFCRPVLVVHVEDARTPSVELELPLALCCRHGRAGPVERYLGPSSLKRLDRHFRARGLRPDWRRATVVVRWPAFAPAADVAVEA
jgi:hypothetical protein